jgi:hypothetical protein
MPGAGKSDDIPETDVSGDQDVTLSLRVLKHRLIGASAQRSVSNFCNVETGGAERSRQRPGQVLVKEEARAYLTG